MKHLFENWDERIRTSVTGSRIRGPTARRHPKMISMTLFLPKKRALCNHLISLIA